MGKVVWSCRILPKRPVKNQKERTNDENAIVGLSDREPARGGPRLHVQLRLCQPDRAPDLRVDEAQTGTLSSSRGSAWLPNGAHRCSGTDRACGCTADTCSSGSCCTCAPADRPGPAGAGSGCADQRLHHHPCAGVPAGRQGCLFRQVAVSRSLYQRARAFGHGECESWHEEARNSRKWVAGNQRGPGKHSGALWGPHGHQTAQRRKGGNEAGWASRDSRHTVAVNRQYKQLFERRAVFSCLNGDFMALLRDFLNRGGVRERYSLQFSMIYAIISSEKSEVFSLLEKFKPSSFYEKTASVGLRGACCNRPYGLHYGQ